MPLLISKIGLPYSHIGTLFEAIFIVLETYFGFGSPLGDSLMMRTPSISVKKVI